MVVDALDVLGLHAVPGEIGVAVELHRHGPDHILDEHGVGVGRLRHVLLVHPLEQGVDLAARGTLHEADHVLNPEEPPKADLDPHDASLVMRPDTAHLLGAGADGRHGDGDPDEEVRLLAVVFPREPAPVVHQALRPGDRGPLFDKVGELDLHVRGFGVELFAHLEQDLLEAADADLPPVLVEDLDEPAHVGALELVGQTDVHVDGGIDVLDPVGPVLDDDGVLDALDADFFDIDLPAVPAALHVDHRSSPV